MIVSHPFVTPFHHTPRSHMFERKIPTSQPIPVMKIASKVQPPWQQTKLQPPNHGKKPLPIIFIGLLCAGTRADLSVFPGPFCQLELFHALELSSSFLSLHFLLMKKVVTFPCNTGSGHKVQSVFFMQSVWCVRCGAVWCG